ncbi:hypothetical protein N9917_00215 [Deltaproteobacteria bacterium]|nr:hypothetical protein [Deltaproteobacteria bacterium]
MLLTWQKHVYEDDEDGNEKEVEILGGGVVVPDCCEYVRKHLTVTLSVPYGDLSDTPACVKDAPEGVSWNDATEATGWKSSLDLWLAEQPEEVRKVTRFDTTTPYWSVGCAVDVHILTSIDRDYFKLPRPPVVCCPHCGTKMPEVERTPKDELPGPVHYPVGDGDYCGTCDERSRSCRCLFPTALWRTLRTKEKDNGM